MTIDEAVTIQHHASTLATDAAQMVGKLICGRDAELDNRKDGRHREAVSTAVRRVIHLSWSFML